MTALHWTQLSRRRVCYETTVIDIEEAIVYAENADAACATMIHAGATRIWGVKRIGNYT